MADEVEAALDMKVFEKKRDHLLLSSFKIKSGDGFGVLTAEAEEGLCWYFLVGAGSQHLSSGLELELHVSNCELLQEV